jgi:leucyl-tRNA synthetase
VDPDQLVSAYGADTARLFILFAAPPEKDLEWSDEGVEGVHRFLGRVWRLVASWVSAGAGHAAAAPASEDQVARVRRAMHRTIQRLTNDIEDGYHFNTAVAGLMEYVNALSEFKAQESPALRPAMVEALDTLAVLLAPFAPHMADELWCALGHTPSVAQQSWPVADPVWLVDAQVTVPVQINGKLRGTVVVATAASQDDVVAAALADPKIRGWIGDRAPKKVVYVPGRLVNLVLG